MFKFMMIFLYLHTSHAQVSGDFGGASGGAVRIGGSATACSSSIQGAVRYDSGAGDLYFCDGYNWKLAATDPCANSLPNNWNFTDLTGQSTSSVVTSSIHQVTNIAGCSIPIKITGSSGSPQYRICDDASCATIHQDWSNSQRTIANNKYIQLRLTTSQAASQTYTVALTVGDRVESWNVTTVSNCGSSEPTPGSICSDGTVFIGRSSDGGAKMYTTGCAAGAAFNGSLCFGILIQLPWSKGGSINTLVTTASTGEIQTSNLAGLSNADSPYAAAMYCQHLVLHGQSDWYLPSSEESGFLRTFCGLIPGGDCVGDRYWTSSEYSTTHTYYFTFNGSLGPQPKVSNTRVRCVRKD
jgi:hypothetical protein